MPGHPQAQVNGLAHLVGRRLLGVDEGRGEELRGQRPGRAVRVQRLHNPSMDVQRLRPGPSVTGEDPAGVQGLAVLGLNRRMGDALGR